MASLEIEGKIVRFLQVQSGSSSRGEWAKQEFLVEYQDGNFPATVVFNVWGADKVQELQRFQVGDQVKVSFRPSSREYNGRFYTDLRAWRIASAAPQAPVAQPQAPSYDNLPAGFAPEGGFQQAPPPTSEDLPLDDDLPF